MLRYFFIIIAISLSGQYSFTQDLILVPDVNYNIVECRIVSIDYNEVVYSLSKDSPYKKISLYSVAQVKFGKETDQILLPEVVVDTIVCQITSVTETRINYTRADNNSSERINKSRVLVCVLNGNCNNPRMKDYINWFMLNKEFYKVKEKSFIIKPDGTRISVNSVMANNTRIIYNTVDNNQVNVTETTDRENGICIVYKNYTFRDAATVMHDYIVPQSGTLKECILKKMSSEEIEMDLVVRENVQTLKTSRLSVCAVFFEIPEKNIEID